MTDTKGRGSARNEHDTPAAWSVTPPAKEKRGAIILQGNEHSYVMWDALYIAQSFGILALLHDSHPQEIKVNVVHSEDEKEQLFSTCGSWALSGLNR